MCDPILVTLLKMRPHVYDNQSSLKNATTYSGTSSFAFYQEVPSCTGDRRTKKNAVKSAKLEENPLHRQPIFSGS